MRTHATWLLRRIKTKLQKKLVKFVAKVKNQLRYNLYGINHRPQTTEDKDLTQTFKQLERKVFEKTKAAPVLISMRMAGRTQAKLQKAAYSFFKRLHSQATGSDIEQRMRKHIFRNVDRVM